MRPEVSKWRQLALFYVAAARVRRQYADVVAAVGAEGTAESVRMMAAFVAGLHAGHGAPQRRMATYLSVSAAVAAAAVAARPAILGP